VARQQAVFLARSLVGYLRQNSPLAEFHFRDMGEPRVAGRLRCLRHTRLLRRFPRRILRGHLAHLAHAALYRMHQMDLYGPVRGGVTWFADDLYRAVRPRIYLG
jgi:NADH dehydrogenase